jgi:ABC-type lipoprotein export system ATPase subunit
VNIKSILTFEGVYKYYEKGGLKKDVLIDVSFSIEQGTINLINGPSGSGKTTLIYLAGLLKKPNNGEIKILGNKTKNFDEKQRAKLIRDQIGIIYQRSNLIPNLTALENVMLPMISSDKEKAQKLLEKVKINDYNKLPIDLSFEDEQKVALARSLVNDPAIILVDEPTAELNSKGIQNFMKLLDKMDNITILMTSDNNSLRKFVDHTFELKDGTIQYLSS